MNELQRLAHLEIRNPAPFLERVEWLRSYLSIDMAEGAIDPAAIEADVSALRKVIEMFDGEPAQAALVQRLDALVALLDAPLRRDESRKELKEFAAQQLCEALAEAKGIEVALLQTGATPDGRPPSHDTLLVFLAMEELKLGESAHSVRSRVRQAIRDDGPTLWRRVKGQPVLQIFWEKSD